MYQTKALVFKFLPIKYHLVEFELKHYIEEYEGEHLKIIFFDKETSAQSCLFNYSGAIVSSDIVSSNTHTYTHQIDFYLFISYI